MCVLFVRDGLCFRFFFSSYFDLCGLWLNLHVIGIIKKGFLCNHCW